MTSFRGVLVITVLCIAVSETCIASTGTPHLSTEQKEALVEAWHAGYHYAIPLVYASVIFVESSACAAKNMNRRRSMGCAQIQAPAVRAVTGMNLPRWVASGDPLRAVNLAIGAAYLARCLRKFGFPGGLTCYNLGPTAAARMTVAQRNANRYALAVIAAMKWLKNLPLSED